MFDTTPKFFESKFGCSSFTGSASSCSTRFWKFQFRAISIGCNFGTAGRILLRFGTNTVWFFPLQKKIFWRGVQKIFFPKFFWTPFKKFFFVLLKNLYMHNTPIKFDAPSSKDLEVTALQSLLLYKHCRFCNFGGCSWSRSDNGKASKKNYVMYEVYMIVCDEQQDCTWSSFRARFFQSWEVKIKDNFFRDAVGADPK